MPELCRICIQNLKSAVKSKNLFNNFLDGQSYSQIYEHFVGSSINESDCKQPENICTDCEKKLISSYKFKLKCQESEEFFANLKVKTESNDVKPLMAPLMEQCIDFTPKKSKRKTEDTSDDNSNSSNLYDVEKTEINIKPEPVEINNEDKSKVPQEKRKRNRNSDKSSTLCPVCGKSCKSSSLLNHLKNHKAKSLIPGKYVCDTCGKTYKYKNGLDAHILAAHRDDKIYNCTECNVTFNTRYSRRYHILKYHSEDNNKCQICSYIGVTPSGLKKHMRTHTGESMPKTHFCTYPSCNKIYKYSVDLKIHQESVHLGKRLYPCDLCKKTYTNQKSLLFHKKTVHTCNKTHICPICPAAFFKNIRLRSHIVKNHPEFELPPLGTSLIDIGKQTRIKF